MALYHRLGVETGFTFALQFFMLISEGLDGVYTFPIHELLLLQQDRAIVILFTSDLISTDLVLTTAAFALIDT